MFERIKKAVIKYNLLYKLIALGLAILVWASVTQPFG